MRTPPSRSLLLDLFATANLAFLVVDVWIAHSANAFRAPVEWAPIAGSAACAVALATALLLARRREALANRLALAVGAVAILIGLTGLVLHLESQFFQTLTLRGLVYSAPFAAPLAFTGLGFLVLLNRMVAPETIEWGRWVCLLALGGFAGNFVLSLADHAQNGFFNPLEWVAVAAAAIAVGFFAVGVLRTGNGALRLSLWVVLALQATTGVLGFVLHLRHLFDPTLSSLRERILYGAPPFAPLLFADLALLGALGLWDLQAKGVFEEEGEAYPLEA